MCVGHLTTEVDGTRIHAATMGAGPAVVLVHGYGVSGRYMLPLARALAPRFSVLVPDLPGHGRSQRSSIAPGIEAHAETLADWLAIVGLERPMVVANSMGCQIVTKVAVRYPERVGPMVLIGPTVDPNRRRARHQIFAALRETAREPAPLVACATRESVGQGIPSLLAAARSALTDRIEDRLPSIEQPTVVILGDRDEFVSRAWAEQVAALLPRGRLAVIPGEPHAVHYTRPTLVGGIVADLLAEETEQAGRELIRSLPHRNMPARKPDDPRGGQKPPPLFGYPNGYEPVVLAPHE
jgi:2-hydroxy-6-oxonona-2,4-dienedioate hydrolase